MATNAQFKVPKEIPEQSSWAYKAVMRDLDGQPIPIDVINTLTLTIYDVATGGIVNGVQNRNIRDTDRGSIGDVDGTLTIKFLPADATILGAGIAIGSAETHIALVRCTYNAGTDAWVREIVHKITNLALVT